MARALMVMRTNFIILQILFATMPKEQNMDKMTYVKVSCGNIKRIKAIGKKGEAFDDVVTKVLDYYEDLQRDDFINTQRNGNQYKEQTKDIRQFYTSRSCL